MRSTRLVTALPAVLLVLAHPDLVPAQSVCVEQQNGNWDWDGYSTIYVYVHPDLARNLESTKGNYYSSTELRRDIEGTLLSFQQEMAVGHPRLKYAGLSSGVAWNGVVGPGTIHLTPYLDPGGGCLTANAYETGGPSGGARITFARSGTGFIGGINQGWDDCNRIWAHFEETGYSRVFRGGLVHEIMHAFGNKHDNCVTVQPCNDSLGCSCGAYGTLSGVDGWNCHLHDRAILLNNHGYFSQGSPTPNRGHEEALDGVSWFSLGTPPPHAPLGGLSARSLSYMFFAFRRPDYVNLYGRLYRWVYTTDAWEYWGYLGDTNDNILGMVGVSYGGSPAYPFFAYTSTLSASDPDRDIRLTRFTAPNTRTTWTYGTDVTRKDGVSVAYDPKSEWHIIAWRDDTMKIQLTLFHESIGFFTTTTLMDNGQPVYAAEPPDLACGDAAVGTWNCILVWAAPMSATQGSLTYQKLRWIHFGVLTGLGAYLTFSTHMEQGYVQYGPPRVAYRGPPTSNSAFVLTWRDSRTSHNTIGKGNSPTAFWDWTTFRSHSSGAGSYGYSAAVGSSAGAAEVVKSWQ